MANKSSLQKFSYPEWDTIFCRVCILCAQN